MLVREVMATEVTVAAPDTTIDAVADLCCCSPEQDAEEVLSDMERQQVRRMPVIDAEGRLVGIVTQGDLERASLRQAAGDKPRL
jgi:CBS domain-containing protein